jgi:phage-related tail fiber protein
MIHHSLTLYPGSEILNLLPELVASLPTGPQSAQRIIRFAGDGGSNPAGLYFYNGAAWERIVGATSISSMFNSNGSTAMTGSIQMGSNTITGLSSPVLGTDAATKTYVDTAVSTGNSASATKLLNARSLTATGDISWTTSFDGSASVSGAATLASSGVAAGTYTKVTVDAKGRVTSATNMALSDVVSSLGYTPLDKAGDTMSGPLVLSGDPTLLLHPATKQYVDNKVQGLNTKPSAKVATTANITLSSTQTVDGINVAVGDLVLVT